MWTTVAMAEEKPLFPFVVSYNTATGVTDLSSWLDRPAGVHGFVRVADAHLVTDKGPTRLWATNLCFKACFPDREQAERLASRLARFGINCVRMHHMDAKDIWGKNPNKLTIDPKQLDKLDYLIYQLKLHGIYTNINLHVSRWLDEAEGFPGQSKRPHYDKGLGNFEPRMIELQKIYARDLLTHINPYTNTSYTNEPAVALVEISNEDALFTTWNQGELDELPDPYATTFRKLWNSWLRKKYIDSQSTSKAWNVGRQPLGDEMLSNSDFSKQLRRHWHLERDAHAQVAWSIEPDGPDGQHFLMVNVTQQGTETWQPQFMQAGFGVKKNQTYTLTFQLRADKEASVAVNCMMAHAPWNLLGLGTSINVGPLWKKYHLTFLVEQNDPNARITFTGLKPGMYQFADISLRPGGIVGLETGQQIEDDTVPVPKRNALNHTKRLRNDFIDFLWDTERNYWWGMYRYLKDELKVQSLVSGTQLSYSPVYVQAGLDYIDAHAYWQHPNFPDRLWDRNNWYVRNLAMVNSPAGTIAGLANRRIAGMAYTVSEYNHPAPNSYAAEGFLMIAAFGSFQAWDGISNFTYSRNTDYEPKRIANYFDIKSDTSKLVHMPACAAMFLRGDVATAKKTFSMPLSPDAERKQLHETLTPWSLTAAEMGLDPRLSLLHGVALDIGKETDNISNSPPPAIAENTTTYVSDTGQIHWDVSKAGAGYFTVDTPNTKVFSGFVAGRKFSLGDVTLEIGPTRLDWATISMVATDWQGFNKPGSILIAATGLVQNTNAQLKELSNDRVTFPGNNWGDEPVICEGIPARIVFPVSAARATLYPLDETGRRGPAVPCTNHQSKAVVTLDPKYKTVWYELHIR